MIERFIKVRYRLLQESPFFSSLCLNLKFIESNKIESAGVDNFFNLYYNKKFIEKLSDEEIKFLLCHEVLHIAFLHLLRAGGRNKNLWNLACDVIINEFIKNQWGDFEKTFLWKVGCNRETLKKFNIKLDNVLEKTAEEIYDILNKEYNNNQEFRNFVDNYEKKSFDKHFHIEDSLDISNSNNQDNKEEKSKESGGEGEKKNGKGGEEGDEEEKGKNGEDGDEIEKLREELKKGKKDIEEIKKELEKNILEKLSRANILEKLRGEGKGNLERQYELLSKSKVSWKNILRKNVMDIIKYDFSYKMPSKKSQSVGIYLPSPIKEEKLSIVVLVDLSGSIGKEELNEFMTEIVSISRNFRRIDMIVLTHDDELQDEVEVKNGNIEKLLNIQLGGGGGTSHLWFLKWLKENKFKRNVKLVIAFTDGYSKVFNKKELGNIRMLWVLNKDGKDEEIKKNGFNEIIWLK